MRAQLSDGEASLAFLGRWCELAAPTETERHTTYAEDCLCDTAQIFQGLEGAEDVLHDDQTHQSQ